MAAIAAVTYLALCPVAHAQMTVGTDIKSLTAWTKSSIGDMTSELGLYSSYLTYRGPQSLNVWAIGGMDWPLTNSYNGNPPSSVTVGVDVVNWLGWTIGFAGSTTYSRPGLTNGGSAAMSGIGGTIYANYTHGAGIGSIVVNLSATVDSLNTNFNRNEVSKSGVLLGNQANVDSLAWLPSAVLHYVFTEQWFKHGPFIGIQTLDSTVFGFSESGSITSRTFNDQTSQTSTAVMGYSAVFDFLNFQPFASIKALYTLSSIGDNVQANFTSGGPPVAPFPLVGKTNLWSYGTSAGTAVFLTPRITGFVAWNANYNDHFGFTENQGLVGASYAF